MRGERSIVTRVMLPGRRGGREERLLILADLHEQPWRADVDAWRALAPTAVLIPGDFLEARGGASDTDAKKDTLALLSALAKICPVYYSFGNHEIGQSGIRKVRGVAAEDNAMPEDDALTKEICECGAVVLHNRYVRHGDLVIGGMKSASGGMLDLAWLSAFMAEDGFHLLLCHHPEYYDTYIRPFAPELTVSGHAHGGHIRFFGRGLYAPGQGIFPRYTGGLYDGGHLLVSRGLGGTCLIPRVRNPRESVLLTLTGKGEEKLNEDPTG